MCTNVKVPEVKKTLKMINDVDDFLCVSKYTVLAGGSLFNIIWVLWDRNAMDSGRYDRNKN